MPSLLRPHCRCCRCRQHYRLSFTLYRRHTAAAYRFHAISIVKLLASRNLSRRQRGVTPASRHLLLRRMPVDSQCLRLRCRLILSFYWLIIIFAFTYRVAFASAPLSDRRGSYHYQSFARYFCRLALAFELGRIAAPRFSEALIRWWWHTTARLRATSSLRWSASRPVTLCQLREKIAGRRRRRRSGSSRTAQHYDIISSKVATSNASAGNTTGWPASAAWDRLAVSIDYAGLPLSISIWPPPENTPCK